MLRVSTGWGFGVIATLAGISFAYSADAQFITRWVDATGVVTYSTSSPPPGVRYEQVPMPARPIVSKSEAAAPQQQAAAQAGSGTTGETTSDKDKPATATGDANVTIEEQNTAEVGEKQWVLSGKVKNDGGAPATGVGIRISILEDGQGNPCLDDTGTVTPSTLAPGDTGTFELHYDSPCFFGSPKIDITAEWQK